MIARGLDETGAQPNKRSRGRKERQFLDAARAERNGGSGPEPVPAAGREDALDDLRGVRRGKAELARRVHRSFHGGAHAEAEASHWHMQGLQEREQDLLRHLGGGRLRSYAREMKRLTGDLAQGRKRFAELTPRQTTGFLTWNSGFTPTEMLDTADGPSKVGLGLRRFRAGMANLRRDGGREVLAAVNDLFAPELQGLIGQHGYDGSVVTGAEFAPPVPHPDSPRHMLLMARLRYRAPDGREGEQYAPVMEDHGHLLLHPQRRGGAVVRSFGMDGLLHHIGALETLYKAVNASPALREKLIDGYLQGHQDEAVQMRDWQRVLGRDPEGWRPRAPVTAVADLPPEVDRSMGAAPPPPELPKPVVAPLAPPQAGRVVSGGKSSAKAHPLMFRPAGTVIRDKHGMRLKSLGGGRWRILK